MIGGGYGYELSRRSMPNGFILKRSRPLTGGRDQRIIISGIKTSGFMSKSRSNDMWSGLEGRTRETFGMGCPAGLVFTGRFSLREMQLSPSP
jgi:hypothetical protein